MNRLIAPSARWLVALTFFALGLPASALPKAAETENAPVTFTTDAAKPRAVTSPLKAPPAKTKKTTQNPHSQGAKKPNPRHHK